MCPVCGAFCNPDTDECLACEEIHHNLLTGGALKPGQSAWYTLPVETAEGKRASFTFYGVPILTVEPNILNEPSLQNGSLILNFIPRTIDGTTRLFTTVVQDE
jgi:hypothetical protein